MIYCNRQEIGKNIHLVSRNPQLRCSLSKARYFDRSRSSRAVPHTVPICREPTPYGQPVECRFSKSAATSVAFLLIAPGRISPSEHFMSWLLYNRGTWSGDRACCHFCAADRRRRNKLVKRSIRVVKVHPCLPERTVTI